MFNKIIDIINFKYFYSLTIDFFGTFQEYPRIMINLIGYQCKSIMIIHPTHHNFGNIKLRFTYFFGNHRSIH